MVHEVEDVIDLFRNRERELDKQALGFLLEAQGFLSDWTQQLHQDSSYIPDCNTILNQAKHYLPDTEDRANQRARKGQKTIETVEFFEPWKSELEEKAKDKETQPQMDSHPEQQAEPASKDHTDPSPSPPENQVPAAGKTDTDAKAPSKADESIRISARKLDALIRVVGEVSIQDEIVWHSKETDNLRSKLSLTAIGLIHKGLKELQDIAFSLRMQVVDGLFRRLDRTARDVARQQDKDIRVAISGGDVELDKSVLDLVKDPLVHIVRNAVDHGIEDSETRENSANLYRRLFNYTRPIRPMVSSFK